MPLTRYFFQNAVSAFFEMSRENAREILPPHLEPIELRHGLGVFSVTAFDFSNSMVGAYQEIVLAVIVPPIIKPRGDVPKSAFYPFIVGTSTKESREHAIERWHLPHHMSNVAVDFNESGGKVEIHVHESGKPILDFTANEHKWSSVNDLYQSFMISETDKFKADIHMKGRFSEHEEETGDLTLYDHAMCKQLRVEDIASYPFRELWMRDGVQTFDELERI
jgi:hypothetical protein